MLFLFLNSKAYRKTCFYKNNICHSIDYFAFFLVHLNNLFETTLSCTLVVAWNLRWLPENSNKICNIWDGALGDCFWQLPVFNNEYLERTPLRYHLAKTRSFQEACINHLRYLRKSLLLHILASFLESNDFITNFITKEDTLYKFSYPESTFSRNSLNSVFSFRLDSFKGKPKIRVNFCIFGHVGRFLSSLNIW